MPEQLQIDVGGSRADVQVFTPSASGKWPAVIYFHDAGGVRDGVAQMAQRFADAGYVVLVPNAYHRQGPFKAFDTRTVFADPSERDRLMTLARGLDQTKLMDDVGFFLDTLGSRSDVTGERVGTVGYCMGGRHALLSAIHHPERVAAVACIHGGSLVTDAPDSPHRRLEAVKARLYFGVADHDRLCTPEHQAELTRALASASKSFALEFYAGAAHGFAVHDLDMYDASAAEQHWRRVLSLFGEALRAN